VVCWVEGFAVEEEAFVAAVPGIGFVGRGVIGVGCAFVVTVDLYGGSVFEDKS